MILLFEFEEISCGGFAGPGGLAGRSLSGDSSHGAGFLQKEKSRAKKRYMDLKNIIVAY
ncbi:MAG: hypothetical protein KF746_21070 [Chitinophagaceae bacterium]|nr:hypothetical protein [Chitinophagaceae bacterium]